MRYISVMGYLHVVSEANWKRFLKASLSNSAAESGGAGDYLGKDKGYIINVTDLGKDQIQDLLNSALAKKKKY